jgi:CRP-like cAMP-binding protein
MSTSDGRHAERNHLLLALSRAEYGRLLPGLEAVSVPAGRVLHQAHETITRIYFPQRCIVSVLVDVEDGERVEVQTIGNEGVVGLAAFLGGGTSIACTVARVPDHAMQMSAAAFQRAFRESAPLRRVLLRYTQSVLEQLARTVLCQRLHPLAARCAHCLVTTQDRVGTDRFLLTQASLAQMVGVRRPSITSAAAELRRAGLIRYSRGRITITDRPGLEAAACPCYAALRADHEGLVGRDGDRPR